MRSGCVLCPRLLHGSSISPTIERHYRLKYFMPLLTYLETGSNFVGKLIRHRGLIKNLVIRDLKSRYVGSAMGFFWSVIHPLVLLASYTFVFSIVMKQRLGPETGTSS